MFDSLENNANRCSRLHTKTNNKKVQHMKTNFTF